jgi:simple sugar transport system permease protein
LAVFTALVLAGLLVGVTDREVLTGMGQGVSPAALLRLGWQKAWLAYRSLFEGALGQPDRIVAALRVWLVEGDSRPLLSALRPLSESLVTAIPYLFAGLAVALGFRAGLFNIGVEGQLLIGALCSAVVGYWTMGLMAAVHMPLALVAGALGAAAWAFLPGFLKARTGAHEVITTIMFNYIALRLSEWLLNGPLEGPPGTARTPDILATAELPRFLPHPIRLHAGLFIALGAAGLVYWLLWKTTLGFELRTVGANLEAARYAGIRVGRIFVIAMVLSGMLAGLAGAVQLAGITHTVSLGFSAGYGFDSIALALLGRSHPLGVTLAALLFGFLRAGGVRMQSVATIPIELISIVQAMVIVFIAAPALVRALYRLPAERLPVAG